ncbi:MAG: SdiA-regulated domain-containing protein [Vampirovibrionia bacterium]
MFKKQYICIGLLFYCSFLAPSFSDENKDDITLKNYSLQNSIKVKLPGSEASGIAYDPKINSFFIHEDSNNTNQLIVVDDNGKFKYRITLMPLKNNDWEDITTNREGRFWIIDSRRSLYQFDIDINGQLVPDSIISYSLPDELAGKNIESIDYSDVDKSIVAIFKGSDNLIYKFMPGDKNAIYLGKIPESLNILPSALTHNKLSGNYFVLAFSGKKIVEFTPDFKKILNVMPLPKRNFYSFQAEGIDFDDDNNLVIVLEKPWYSLFGHSKFIKMYYKK